MTNTVQGHPRFHARFSGPNSLGSKRESVLVQSADLVIGCRPWENAEAVAVPELVRGSGLSGSLGLGSPSNADAAGTRAWSFNLTRLFVRQTIDISYGAFGRDDDPMRFQRPLAIERVTLTAGRFAADDIFDNNRFAHDARTQFPCLRPGRQRRHRRRHHCRRVHAWGRRRMGERRLGDKNARLVLQRGTVSSAVGRPFRWQMMPRARRLICGPCQWPWPACGRLLHCHDTNPFQPRRKPLSCLAMGRCGAMILAEGSAAAGAGRPRPAARTHWRPATVSPPASMPRMPTCA
jgi:hypothetical protein